MRQTLEKDAERDLAKDRHPQRMANKLLLRSKRPSSIRTNLIHMEALLALEQQAVIAPERLDLMVARYAYLAIGRRSNARRFFKALAASDDREGVKGLATLNNVDQTDR